MLDLIRFVSLTTYLLLGVHSNFIMLEKRLPKSFRKEFLKKIKDQGLPIKFGKYSEEDIMRFKQLVKIVREKSNVPMFSKKKPD